MLNSEEIAKLAGVSRSTVSKVLNGYPNISKKTKDKILDIVKKNKYIPNPNAQALAGKINKVIGIFIYEKDYEKDLLVKQGQNFSYFTDFINSCMKEAFLCQYQVLVDVIKDDLEEARIERLFKTGSITGGIVIGLSQNNKFIENLIEKEYKLALIDYKNQLANHKNTLLINIKDFEASYRITEKLIHAGKKNILYIAGDENKRTGFERKKGFIKALENNNLKLNNNLIISSNFQREDSYQKIKKFLKSGIKFDGVISANDTMAYSYLAAIKDLKLDIKLKNITVWGYDNLKYTFIQGIKTAAPNFNKAAIEAIKFLTNLGNKKEENCINIDVKLIETLEDYINS